VRSLREPKGRVRWLSGEEFDRLCRELPQHLRDMVVFAAHTGLREALVDLRRGMAALVKNRQSLGVPLDSTALAVVREQIGKYSERVFMYKEWPVRKMNKDGWCKALRPAGIKDFRVHDLQHQLTSMHAQAGTPLNVLQALGGRKAPTMV
jgi:integrase